MNNMEIRIITEAIAKKELSSIATHQFGDMVKAVVDIQRNIIAIGGELHADEEAVLLENGSKQADLWGINLYIDKPEEEWIEFNSMINIRPSQNNRSRSVENQDIKKNIKAIVASLIIL